MNREAPGISAPVNLDIEGVKRLLPHRPPFLLIDRLHDIQPGKSAVGWKAVTINEPWFAGHFPDYAVMPGVLIVEAMAQAAGALVVYTLSIEDEHRMVYFMTIDKARFRRPVRPGDVLRIPVRVQRHRGSVWRFEGRAFVGEELCAEAEYSAMLTEQSFNSMSAAAMPSDAE
jgi:3-hydroxyacyl-[acyl-carrier-protein] dehydratase